jgi:hypothetical protein
LQSWCSSASCSVSGPRATLPPCPNDGAKGHPEKGAEAKWIKRGYLNPKLPGVYAVGHGAPGIEGDLAAALLYAGPGAMLSHGTAAWWFGPIDTRPVRSTSALLADARRDAA